MKKLIIIIAAVSAICLASCSGGNKEKEYVTYEDAEHEFEATLTDADSTLVLDMANSFMKTLKEGNVEAALNQLYEFQSDGKVRALSDDTRDRLVNLFTQFPVKDFELDYFAFSISTLNDVKYFIYFADADDNGERPRISFTLNPMKIDDKWYLCTKQEPINPKAIVDVREAE
jgi:hypothetical protein